MAVWHQTYALDNVTPVALRLHGNDRRRGSVAIVQHSGHGSSYHVILGGPGIDLATDSYGHRLVAGDSLTIAGDWSADDVMYAMVDAASGEVHVLIVGA